MRTAEEILIEKEILFEHKGTAIFNEDIFFRNYQRIFADAMKEYAREAVKERTEQIKSMAFELPLGMPHVVLAHIDLLSEPELP